MTKRTRGQELKGNKEKKDVPRSVIYVITEGHTEELYLNHFTNREYNVYVVPKKSEYTNAVGIVRAAKTEYIDKPRKIDISKGDRVYCVFDSDPASNPDIREAFDLIRGNKKNGLECIFSNPCFEVWFVMHYEEPPYSMDASNMKSKIKSIMRTIEGMNDYSETKDIFNILLPLIEEAKVRAERLDKSQKQVQQDVLSHECNPYTNIHEFLKYIEDCKNRNSKSL